MESGGEGIGRPGAQESCLGEREQLLGAVLYALILEPSAWIRRRVENVELLDEAVVRRRVSIDLELDSELDAFGPSGSDRIGLLPLTLLRKETLRNFDLRDAAERPVPMLTRAENERLAAALLIVSAEGILEGPLPCALEASLRQVAGGEPDEARAEITSWRTKAERQGEPDREIWAKILASAELTEQAEALAENFILLAAVEVELDRRLLYKFSYEEPFGEEQDLDFAKDLAVRLGWRRKEVRVEAPGVAWCASYHLEVLAPRDLEIDAAQLRIDADGRSGPPGREDVFDDDRDRAHLYVSDLAPGLGGTARIFLRRRRDSFLFAAFLTGALISVLMAGGLVRLDQISKPAQSQTAAALLLVVPTVLAAYIVRPGEHRMASRMLLGVRLFLLVDAACAAFGVALLAGGYSGHSLHCAWLVGLIVSILATLGLLVTLLLPRPTGR